MINDDPSPPRKAGLRRWRLRPTRHDRAGAQDAAPVGQQIAERLRRSHLRAVVDPAADEDQDVAKADHGFAVTRK